MWPIQVLVIIYTLESYLFKFRVTVGSAGTPDVRISKVRGSIPTAGIQVLSAGLADT